MLRASRNSRMEASAKIALTPVCASSKFPLIAQTATLSPVCVVIWSFCIGLMPSSG